MSPAPAAATRGLPPVVVPFPVAPTYRVRPDLVPLGRAPEYVDDPGPATPVRLDDGAPAALDHALRELEEAPDAVRWADAGVASGRWWGIANAVAHALAAEGDPRVGPAAGVGAFGDEDVGTAPTSAALVYPWLGLRVTRAGALERTVPAPDAPRGVAARAPRVADALARLPAATRALDALRLAIAEDLVVLLRDRRGDGGRAAYLFVAAPSGWDPGARGNADLAELHAPVPHAGPLRAAGAAIADAMVDKGPFVRHVWSLAADDAPSHHPRRHPATPLGGRDPATWWLRVERQTTLPLPSLGASAFFIRVLHQPLARAVAGPGRRARLASAVRSMDAALRAYKGLAGSADALLAWLGESDAGILSASAARRPDRRTMDYDLSLLKVPVRDVERAAAFYRDVLGMTPSFVAAEYGWAQFSAGALPLALYVPGMGGGDGEPGGSGGFHLALDADAFDVLAERLRVAGALVDGRVHRGADGTVFVEARDPDGNVIKVVRAARED